VAGAVCVINQEQIARSGLTSVPELLRLAPGIDVARCGSCHAAQANGGIGRSPHAGNRPDRARHKGGSGKIPSGGDGWLRLKADSIVKSCTRKWNR